MRALFLLIAAFLAFSAPAMAQGPNCAPRNIVVNNLAEKYGETRRSVGLSSQETVVETWASDTSGSWSITVTLANGITCLISSGLAFEAVAVVVPPNL